MMPRTMFMRCRGFSNFIRHFPISQAMLPVSIVARSMNNRKNNQRIGSNNKEDSIRKTAHEDASNLGALSQPEISRRVVDRASNGRLNFRGQLQSQSSL